MYIASEQAIGITQVALAKLTRSAAERAEAVSGAKVLVANACRLVSQAAVQLHGGIGTTEDLAIGTFFRRAMMIERMLGDADYHLDRYRQALT